MSKKIELKVVEAYTRDVARGIIRMDYKNMDEVEVSTGDCVKITFKDKSIVAKAMPLYPSDEDKQMCRTDGLIRKNLGLEIGESAHVEKTEISPAISLEVKLNVELGIDSNYIPDALEGVVVQVGQLCMIPYFGGKIEVTIISTNPEGKPVQISKQTVVRILDNDENKKEVCLNCLYCDEPLKSTRPLSKFCSMNHKIRWTIRDELKGKVEFDEDE